MTRRVALLVLLAGLSALSPQPSALAEELIAWDVLRNGLVALSLDTDGDGLADRVELHVVARWGRTVLTDAELDAQAAQDALWFVVVEGDDGRVVYWIVRAPLVVETARDVETGFRPAPE